MVSLHVDTVEQAEKEILKPVSQGHGRTVLPPESFTSDKHLGIRWAFYTGLWRNKNYVD